MNIKEKLKRQLKLKNISYTEDEKSISVPGEEDGFDVTLFPDQDISEPYVVFYGDMYHEHFEDEEDAIKCFMFGLSNKCRLRVEYWGNKAYRWIMEYKRENGEFEADYETGCLLKPFWKKKTVKYLQNHHLN
jgi:hypothetical protein